MASHLRIIPVIEIRTGTVQYYTYIVVILKDGCKFFDVFPLRGGICVATS